MAPTLPAKPDQRPPAGELLTYTVFNDVGLWVTYRTEDDYIVLEHGWINGRWVSLYDLLGEPQYLAWCNATEADLYADAEALARDVAEDAAIFNWQCRTGVFA